MAEEERDEQFWRGVTEGALLDERIIERGIVTPGMMIQFWEFFGQAGKFVEDMGDRTPYREQGITNQAVARRRIESLTRRLPQE